MNLPTDLDPAERVDVVTFSGRESGLTLEEAVRRIVEHYPAKTAKQLSAFIERFNGQPPIGPLSAIIAVHQHFRASRLRGGVGENDGDPGL